MKAWHIVVMDGWKQIKDVVKFDTQESKDEYKKLKEEYAKTNPTYRVTREWY